MDRQTFGHLVGYERQHGRLIDPQQIVSHYVLGTNQNIEVVRRRREHVKLALMSPRGQRVVPSSVQINDTADGDGATVGVLDHGKTELGADQG
jgi:hypothetical protein